MELTNLSRIAGDEIEALRTSLDRACVMIPDGRRLLATEHAALMTFARANGITEKMLWDRIIIRHHGRVTEGDFACCRVTDITALASCTKFEVLSLHVNEIADISALANCGELVTLELHRNRITDISALASCGKLKMACLAENSIADISTLW
jgi:Leucine Rich Repeat (LRR) protein